MVHNFILVLLILTYLPIAGASATFGEPVDKKNLLDITAVVNSSKKFIGKNISVKGKVKKICLKKGCWLNLNAGDQFVRVTFKDYGIFVPSSFLDKIVAIKGILNLREESVARQRHLLEDEGRPRSEIDKIKEPKKIYSLVASGIEII